MYTFDYNLYRTDRYNASKPVPVHVTFFYIYFRLKDRKLSEPLMSLMRQ